MKCAALLLALCGSFASAAPPESELSIESSRPETVTGGDALVRWSAPARSDATVWLGERNVTSAFQPVSGSSDLLARLTGLAPGTQLLAVRANGKVRTTLSIENHPTSGPVFSGPRHETFICETLANDLGAALDRDCNAGVRITYYYKSTAAPPATGYDAMVASFSSRPGSLDAGFKALDPAGPIPADVARIDDAGCAVDYIVRREVGTINRAVYDIQFLHSPGQPLPSPWHREGCGWNGRLVYLFGGGRGAGYHQGVLGPVGRTQEPLLSLRFAIATSTLNVWETNGDDRVSAETLSLVKEHFTEQYGRPVHTIGWGSSGGGLQQYLIAQNYPGLLDGIIPSLSFPDWTTSALAITDCALLAGFFDRSAPAWSEEQKTAVSGFATWRTCIGWRRDWALADAREYCDRAVPRELVYDPVANPRGLRCDYYSNLKNVLGVDPRSGWVRRPLDNVGVQYGLAAFNAGTISTAQFLALNEGVGGFDRDGRITGRRTEADPEALRIAYQRGVVLTGGGGLSETPIIDWRQYSDDLADVHDSVRSFVTRARMIAAQGTAGNQTILIDPRPDPFPPDTRFIERQRELLTIMDDWLTRIASDDTASDRLAKIVRHRPSSLTEGCWATNGERLTEHLSSAEGRCHRLYPRYADPRIVAGGSLAGDVLKCALKPVEPTDYSHPLNAGELARLSAIFPNGVCDFGRPGIGQEITTVTWQQF